MSYNYKELSDQAYKLHTMKKYADAEKLYKMLLDISPQDANVLNLYGLLCINKKDYEKAISLLSQAVIFSKSDTAMLNLAKAYLSNREYDKSIKILKDLIMKNPTDDALYSLAIAYKKNNMPDKAMECYKLVLKINPKHYNACYNLTIILRDYKMYSLAIKYANQCLEIMPNSEEVYVILSYIYEQMNDYNNAILSLEKAVEISPNEYLYYYNLGVLYSKINDIEKAKNNYLNVLSINPSYFQALVNLCTILRENNPKQALEYILRAKEIAPAEKNVLLTLAQIYKDMYKNKDSIDVLKELIKYNKNCHEAYSILASNYMDLGDYSNALFFYTMACDLCPNNLNYKHGKAIALKYMGKIKRAQKILEEIVQCPNATNESKISLGMIYLSQKDFEKGMTLYRERNTDTSLCIKNKDKLFQPNQDITCKKILIYSNCGLGDTIMYSRYIPILREKMPFITMQTDSELVNILKYNFPDVKVVNKSALISTNYDVIIPVMDLPLALNKDFSEIPYPAGYLQPEPETVENLSTIPELKTKKFKVGLFWQGNKKIFKNRSIPYEKLEPLLENNMKFYSFQIDFDTITSHNIVHLNKYIKDYSDTAALLSRMDLLITIDSSIAHMAGAMGLKTFLLLPYTAEWRWFDDTETTPWYQSIRIFKQDINGNWDSVISAVNEELKNYEHK